jgi:hypothetical protein
MLGGYASLVAVSSTLRRLSLAPGCKGANVHPRGLSLVPRHTGTLAHGSGSNPVRLQVKACSDWHTAPAHECGLGHALRRVLN